MNALDFIAARAPFAEARAQTPATALLGHLAGEHAERIAVIWPAPHLDFLALPASRRHLAAIALARTRPDKGAPLRALIERAPLREALGYSIGAPPRSLARALSRLGERLWPAHSYDLLLRLLAEPGANLVLRHAAAIDDGFLTRLDALPAPLRAARIVHNVCALEAARALAQAFAAARWINARRAERDIVLAWSRAGDAETLLRAAIDALKPDRFGQMGPAPEMAPPYRRIASRAALESAAVRFRNCAAGYVWETGADEMALYVREGDLPALIALKRDIGGWRLAEALAPENAALSDDALGNVAEEFARAGVRLGPPVRTIEDRLEELADAMNRAQAAPVTLRAALGLGQLWR